MKKYVQIVYIMSKKINYANCMQRKCEQCRYYDYCFRHRPKRRKSVNINKNINKLLYALLIKGKIYKINTFQFYSEKNCKYCIKYQILKREQVEIYNEETDNFELQDRYKQKEECYSKIDVMKYLIDEYRKGSEADGI